VHFGHVPPVKKPPADALKVYRYLVGVEYAALATGGHHQTMTIVAKAYRFEAFRFSDVSAGVRQVSVAVLLLISASTASALSILEEYELQERCGRRAEEIFRKDWGKGMSQSGGSIFEGNYNNHYNKKLNKCFYLIWSTAIARKGKEQSTTRSAVLYDINGNKEYGAFSQLDTDMEPSRCVVLTNSCRSRQEFDKLVAPLMHD
jgi:hypothetical protein